MRYKQIKNKSRKKKLRDKAGKLHLQLLKHQRDNYDTCEICGKKTDRLGRFHILRVGQSLRYEFIDNNILLTGWYCCHFPHHHYGSNDKRNEWIKKRIIQLRGKNHEEKIKIEAELLPNQSEDYYKNLIWYFEEELKQYES